ncbi:hypothetical protein CCYA_CCYA03G0955 [Cyanidiococcus yangmingshanensis]|nr:hypothetical protein CCYA_CCYA03G0955 [Cyanidiococcus yangmingshanensis]
MHSFSNRECKSRCDGVRYVRRRFHLIFRVVWVLLSVAVLVQVCVYELALHARDSRRSDFVVLDLEKDLLFRTRPSIAGRQEITDLSYLRVRSAVLKVGFNHSTVFVLCTSLEACRSTVQDDGEILFFNEKTKLHVRAAYRSASITVRFVLNPVEKGAIHDECRQSDGGWEPATTIYQPLTPFVMKNLAHWTFDLVYPLYATMRMLEKGPLGRLVRLLHPPRIVFDTTSLQRPNRSELGLPTDARRLLRRLGRLSTRMTSRVEFRSLGRSSGTTLCFRDLVLGAREQNLRRSNWNYMEPPERMRLQRQKLLNDFRMHMQRYAQQRCSPRRIADEAVAARQHPLLSDGLPWQQQKGLTLILGRNSVRRRLRNVTALVHGLPNAHYLDAFGSLPWCLQYAYIRETRRLVAMHGAEWSHLFLIRKPSRLRSVELFPPCAKPLTFYAAVARHLGVRNHTTMQTSTWTQMEFDERYPQQRRCASAMRNRSAGVVTLPERCCLDANIALSLHDQRRILGLLAAEGTRS